MAKSYLQSPLLNLNIRDFMSQTALHRALSKGKPQIADMEWLSRRTQRWPREDAARIFIVRKQ